MGKWAHLPFYIQRAEIGEEFQNLSIPPWSDSNPVYYKGWDWKNYVLSIPPWSDSNSELSHRFLCPA